MSDAKHVEKNGFGNTCLPEPDCEQTRSGRHRQEGYPKGYPKIWRKGYKKSKIYIAPSGDIFPPVDPKDIQEWEVACKLVFLEKKRENKYRRGSGKAKRISRREAVGRWAYKVMGRFNAGEITVDEAEWLLDRPRLSDEYREEI